MSSNVDGELYTAKVRIENDNNTAIKTSTTIIPGATNNVIEGQLEWKTRQGVQYDFPVSINPTSAVNGAQIAQVPPNSGSGYVLVSFSKNSGADKTLSIKPTSGCSIEAKSVMDHGWWNIDNSDKGISDFNLTVKAANVVNNYGGTAFTIVKKDNDAAVSSYALLGDDPNSGAGFSSTSLVSRNNFKSFSDFAIASFEASSSNDWVLPNYFSPNGDGQNDNFNLSGLTKVYPNLKLMVYNRWGTVVYRSAGTYDNNWQGEDFNGSALPDGVYYYIIELTSEFEKSKTGFIEIMR